MTVQVLRDLDELTREREVFLRDRQNQAEQLKTWSKSVTELKSQVCDERIDPFISVYGIA